MGIPPTNGDHIKPGKTNIKPMAESDILGLNLCESDNQRQILLYLDECGFEVSKYGFAQGLFVAWHRFLNISDYGFSLQVHSKMDSATIKMVRRPIKDESREYILFDGFVLSPDHLKSILKHCGFYFKNKDIFIHELFITEKMIKQCGIIKPVTSEALLNL